LIADVKPLIVILGPTGSGKSDLSLALATECGGEIVSCDSIQVYKGLDVGSAKVPPGERQGIRHHLIDILSVDETITAGEYSRLAREAIAQITSRHRLPIVVGGTGLYLRALLDGLSPAPPRDPLLRARLERLADKSPRLLHRFLRIHDPVSARRIHPNDIRKLIRAVELTKLACRPASATQAIPRQPLTGFRVLKLGLAPDREELYRKLNKRAAWMFSNGLLEETRRLLSMQAEGGLNR
jgi:tRNA dimethylallyltransferase